MIRQWLFMLFLFSLSLATLTCYSAVRSAGTARIANPPFQASYFLDNFSGPALNSSNWNSTFATSGLRWCPSSVANHLAVPGIWQNPSTTSCQGAMQSPPFGSLSISNGSATFSALGSQTFPYIWSGHPTRASPFPSSGNFVLDVKIRYNVITGSGAGFFVNRWNDTDPLGNNPPEGHPRVFVIWADTSELAVQLLGNFTFAVGNQYLTHDYELEYVNGQYSVFVDGSLAIGPVSSNVVPNSIWVGNPVIAWWHTPQDWSSFSLSQVQVTTPSIQISPSTGPVGTKVVVQGSGIPSPTVEVTFDDNFIGTTSVSNGIFSFTLDVPQAQLGFHEIKAVDVLGNVIALQEFVVSASGPTTLAVSLTVGTVYFPGDTVVASLLVTSNGLPLSSSVIQVRVNLTRPDNSHIALNLTSIGSGLFRTSYNLPKTALIGTYSVIAAAHSSLMIDGSALASFEVKLPWLSSQASTATIAGLASVATVGIALVSWRKGYFKRSPKDTF